MIYPFLLSAAFDLAWLTIYHPAYLCLLGFGVFILSVWMAEHDS